VAVPMGMKHPGPPKGPVVNRKKLMVDGQHMTDGDGTDPESKVENATDKNKPFKNKKPMFRRFKKSDDSVDDGPFWTDQPKNTTEQVEPSTFIKQDADTEDTLMASEQLTDILKGDFSALPAEVVEYIEKLEDTVIDLEAAAEAAPASTETETTEVTKRAEPEDILKSADPAVRELFAKMQADLSETQSIAKAEQAARVDREMTDLAKSFPAIPVATDDLKTVLKSASADADLLARVTDVLKAANEALATGALLEEVGKRAPGVMDAEDKVESIAKSLQKDDASLSYEQAYDRALQANPDLYRQITEG